MKTYHDIEGDGGSNVVGQVTALRASIAEALSGVQHLLAVGSGKGGVGKSTLTMALARAMNAEGRRVAILDGDFNGPCQARLAGLEASPWIPGEDGLAIPRNDEGIGVVSFGSLLADSDPLEIDSVAPDEQQTWRATREFAMLGQLLAGVAWGELDVLLFDLPPGSERTLQFAQFLPGPTAFVMVTIPSDLSRGVVARSITALAATEGRLLGHVENMAGYYCEGCGSVRPLFPTPAVELESPCLGSIPFDPDLAAPPGAPVAPDDDRPSRQAVGETARRILESLETAS